MTRCFIGLGANLGNSHETLCLAAQAMDRLISTRVLARSLIYRSAPIGPQNQADYLNAVIALETGLEPLDLLASLQALENMAGRTRHTRWGPRTLDLDILIYGTTTLRSRALTLPHPRLLERNFVLRPLADIAGEDWLLADGLSIAQHLDNCPHNDLTLTQLNWSKPSQEAISA